MINSSEWYKLQLVLGNNIDYVKVIIMRQAKYSEIKNLVHFLNYRLIE